jgi:positive regulator of sigma E activity
MHLSDGEIRAFLDRELEPGRLAQVQAHLSTCSRCQAQKQVLFSRAQRIDHRLATLETHHQPHLSAGTARLRLSQRLKIDLEEKEKLPMWRKYFSQLSRPAWIAIAVVALLAISMAFAPVRAIAGSFLGLFRVQSIDVVQVDPSLLKSQLDSSSFSAIMSESVNVTGGGPTQDVADAQAASQLTGFQVRLPANMQSAYLAFQPGSKADYKVNRDQLQALLAEIGHPEIQIPAALDGATLSVEIHGGAVAEYGDCPSLSSLEKESNVQELPVARQSASQSAADSAGKAPDVQQLPAHTSCTTLVQMPSPTISAPPGLDLEAVGQAYLQVLGMSPADAATYASNVDWSSTLVIPIPRNGTSSSSVSVDGVTGTLVTQYPGSSRGQYVLAWVKNGILYGLTGPGDGSNALDIANSLK